MHKEPLVSVIMATFNEPKQFIEESISSILHQTYSNFELLIADDSTKEETIEVIDNFATNDNRVRVIRKEKRMGFVCALNIALKEAKGDYIARMDGDDMSLPDRFVKQIEFLESHAKIDVLGGAMNIINEKSEVTSSRHYPTGGYKLLFWMALRTALGHPSVMFRRKIIDNGFFYNEIMNRGCEDTDLWLRLRNNGYKIANLNDIIVNYRVIVDMASKRKKDDEVNYFARKNNLSVKYFFFDIISLIVFKIRIYMPTSIYTWLYKKENCQQFK